MSELYCTLKLENVNVIREKSLIESINAKDNNLLLEFSMPLCDIQEMFKYYVNRNVELIDNIDIYDCIDIDIENRDTDIYFTLNPSDDEEDMSDIKFIDRELKKHFGLSVLDCKLVNILRILLMDCKGYSIEEGMLIINIYYDNFKDTWLEEYLNKITE